MFDIFNAKHTKDDDEQTEFFDAESASEAATDELKRHGFTDEGIFGGPAYEGSEGYDSEDRPNIGFGTYMDDSDNSNSRHQDAGIARVDANGRFFNPPPQPEPNSHSDRKPSTGRFMGNSWSDAGVYRDPDTGKFVSDYDR